MNTDPEQWRDYVPRPLDFVDTWAARLTINNYLLLQRFGFLPPS